MPDRDLEDLIGSVLEDIRQIEDYYHMTLSKAFVSLYNPLRLPTDFSGWRTATLGCLVTDITLHEGDVLMFSFSNGHQLVMSLRPEDYECPEAAVFMYRPRPNKVVVIE